MTDLRAADGEFLEDGTGPTTPSGDNLLLDFVRNEAAAYRTLVSSLNGRIADEPGLGVLMADAGVPTPFGNTAHLTRPLTADNCHAVVAALQTFFGAAHGGPFLVFSAWPTPDLRSAGFSLVGHPPLMLRPAGATAVTSARCRIVRVKTLDQLAEFERTLIDAYPVPEMQPWVRGAFLDPAILRSDWRFFVGYDGDAPIATAAAHVSASVTLVELVSTSLAARGQGVGAAMTASASTTEPDRPALLIASDTGRSVYARLGYLPLLRETLWIGNRATSSSRSA